MSDQAELESDVAQQRNLQAREFAVERNVATVAGIELLGIRQPFDEFCAGFGAALQFVDGIAALRID